MWAVRLSVAKIIAAQLELNADELCPDVADALIRLEAEERDRLARTAAASIKTGAEAMAFQAAEVAAAAIAAALEQVFDALEISTDDRIRVLPIIERTLGELETADPAGQGFFLPPATQNGHNEGGNE
jgi:hypothetical protein